MHPYAYGMLPQAAQPQSSYGMASSLAPPGHGGDPRRGREMAGIMAPPQQVMPPNPMPYQGEAFTPIVKKAGTRMYADAPPPPPRYTGPMGFTPNPPPQGLGPASMAAGIGVQPASMGLPPMLPPQGVVPPPGPPIPFGYGASYQYSQRPMVPYGAMIPGMNGGYNG